MGGDTTTPKKVEITMQDHLQFSLLHLLSKVLPSNASLISLSIKSQR